MRCHYCIFSIKESENCHFHTILLTGFAHLLSWFWWRISNTQIKNSVLVNKHLSLNLPECVASVLTHGVGEICKMWRNSGKYDLFVARPWESLKKVGYLPSFIGLHSFMTSVSKTSLRKRFSVSDSQSGTGSQNCSVAPDSGLGAGMKRLTLSLP